MVAHNILTRSPLQRHPAFRYMCNHTFGYMCIVDCEILFSSTRAMFIQGRSLRSLPSVNLMTIAVKVQRQVHDNIYDHMWSSARCIWDLEAGMQHTVCRCLCRVCRRWSRVCSAGYAAAAAAAGAPDRGAPAGDKFGAEAPGGRLLLLVLPPPAQSRPADFWLSRYSREWFHKFEAEAPHVLLLALLVPLGKLFIFILNVFQDILKSIIMCSKGS